MSVNPNRSTAPRVECPVCKRQMTFNCLGAVDVDNRPVLEFHMNPNTKRECACSGHAVEFGRQLMVECGQPC